MKVIFTCGGRCGQIYSMIAMYNEFRRQDIEFQNEYAFICSDSGLEEKILEHEGIKEILIVKSKSGKETKRDKISESAIKGILRKLQPGLVISTGGFPANCVVKEASKQDIPFALMETEIDPCSTDKKLYKRALKVILANEFIKKYISAEGNITVTGVPSRLGRPSASRAELIQRFGLNPEEKIVAVLGGCGDFGKINDVVLKLVKGTMFKHQIVWAVGNNVKEEIVNKIRQLSTKICVVKYFDNINDVLAIADLVVSRAGAMTVQEIKQYGLPAVLIPNVNKDDTLQYSNALELKKMNTAEILLERSVNKYVLKQTINDILKDEERIMNIRHTYDRIDRRPNNQRIYEEIMGSLNATR